MNNLRELQEYHTSPFSRYFLRTLLSPSTIRNMRPSRSPECLSDFPQAIRQKSRARKERATAPLPSR